MCLRKPNRASFSATASGRRLADLRVPVQAGRQAALARIGQALRGPLPSAIRRLWISCMPAYSSAKILRPIRRERSGRHRRPSGPRRTNFWTCWLMLAHTEGNRDAATGSPLPEE
jgi:hypothetical protein